MKKGEVLQVAPTLLLLLFLLPHLPGQEGKKGWQAQARALLARGEAAQALQVIDRFLATRPGHPTALVLKGFALLRLERPGEARAVCLRAIEAGAGADAWAALAAAAQGSGDQAQALEAAVTAINRGRTDAQVYRIGGRALLAQGRDLEAVAWLRQAVLLAPEDLQARQGFLSALLAAGLEEEAAAQADAAMVRFGPRIELVRRAATASLMLGREERAADLLRLLHLLGRAQAEEVATLGDLVLRADRPEEALRLYDRAAGMGLEGPRLARRRALAWWHAGKLERAEKILAGLKEKEPSTLVELGELRAALDRHEEAIRAFHRALEQEPEAPAAHAGLGWSYLALERWDEAEQAFRALLSRSQRPVEAYLALARISRHQGDLRGALAQVRRARAAGPADTRVVSELIRLERLLLEQHQGVGPH